MRPNCVAHSEDNIYNLYYCDIFIYIKDTHKFVRSNTEYTIKYFLLINIL